MRIAFDSNRYIDFAKGDEHCLECVRQAHEVCFPLVVLAELRAGFACGTKSEANENNLVRFLTSKRARILYPDDATTHHYANLFRQLKKQGTPIPTNDIWIAALVLQYDSILFTRDKHFEYLKQIPRL